MPKFKKNKKYVLSKYYQPFETNKIEEFHLLLGLNNFKVIWNLFLSHF